MKTYIEYNGQKVRCVYTLTQLFVLFDEYPDIKVINNKWVMLIRTGADNNIVNRNYCYISLSKQKNYGISDFVYCFDVLYSFVCFDSDINCVEVGSFGFNDFFNKDNGSSKKVNEAIYKQKLKIDKKQYQLEAFNDDQSVSSFDCLNETIKITKCRFSDKNILLDELTEIIQYCRKLLQFVTIGSKTRIDNIELFFANGGSTSLIINHERLGNFNQKETYSIPLVYFQDKKAELFKFINSYFNKPYNVFFNTKEIINEDQIPSTIGEFEYIFNKSVKKDLKYKNAVKNKRQIINFEQLKSVINNFKSDNNISDTDFNDFYGLIKNYSFSIEYKINYVIEEMCSCLKLVPIDFGFGRTTVEFAKRQTDTRKTIVHGKKTDEDELVQSMYTIEIFQELIYFMVIKYIIRCNDEEIASIFNTYYFQMLNLRCSLLPNK